MHFMRPAVFRLLARNRPQAPIEVDFGPLQAADFISPLRGQEEQLVHRAEDQLRDIDPGRGRLRVFGKSPRPNADCPRALTKIISAHSGLVEANSIVRQPGVPVTRKFNPRSCASLVSLIKRGLVEGGPRLMQVT
jgi:hypothetical protein